MVAWKDSREVRRRVRDALPFIKQAERVTILSVCEHGTETQAQKSIDYLTKCLLRPHRGGEGRVSIRRSRLLVSFCSSSATRKLT
jgi:hypothetical protein